MFFTLDYAHSRIPFFSKASASTVFAFFIGCGVGFFIYPFYNEAKILPLYPEGKLPTQACFSPEGYCTNRIISAIANAKSSILVQAYSFTCPQIANALSKAFERGVDVKILIDKSQLYARYSQLPFLFKKGIPIFIDPAVGIAHNKTMIFDARHTLTGSFNWSEAANFKNAENILLIDDPSLAQIYKQNWEKRALIARRVKSSSFME